MNSVSLIGRLTKDVELKYTQSGKAVASGTIAVDRTFKNQDGEREADFISYVVWDKAAENLQTYTGKGSRVSMNGRLQTRNYENQQGQKVYVTEVIAENVEFLDSKAESEKRQQERDDVPNMPTADTFAATNNGSIDIKDDDLPF